MAIQIRGLKLRTTNDKILQAFLQVGQDDGIHYEEINRTGQTVTAGQPVTGTNIIPESQVFPGEDVKGIILDTNHIEAPSGYIISLCFFTKDGNDSKLYMGRVSGGATPTWTQCADSPKVYENTEILSVFSSFLNTESPSPIKIVQRQTPSGGDVIIERH